MAEGNSNVPNINHVFMDQRENLERLFVSRNCFELVLENLMQVGETDSSWNLLQELNFPENIFAVNTRSRLLNVHVMCTYCKTRTILFLGRLYARIRRRIQLRMSRRVPTLQEKFMYLLRLYVMLTNIMTEIENLIARVANAAVKPLLTEEFENDLNTVCMYLEDNVQTLILNLDA